MFNIKLSSYFLFKAMGRGLGSGPTNIMRVKTHSNPMGRPIHLFHDWKAGWTTDFSRHAIRFNHWGVTRCTKHIVCTPSIKTKFQKCLSYGSRDLYDSYESHDPYEGHFWNFVLMLGAQAMCLMHLATPPTTLHQN